MDTNSTYVPFYVRWEIPLVLGGVALAAFVVWKLSKR